jgi:hypothetical protein
MMGFGRLSKTAYISFGIVCSLTGCAHAELSAKQALERLKHGDALAGFYLDAMSNGFFLGECLRSDTEKKPYLLPAYKDRSDNGSGDRYPIALPRRKSTERGIAIRTRLFTRSHRCISLQPIIGSHYPGHGSSPRSLRVPAKPLLYRFGLRHRQ